jgi:chlorobactene glucosyltransferase
MYTSWAAVRAGFAKNILAGHGGQVIFLLLSTVFHWALFALPWLWLALGWLIPGLQTAWPWAPMVLSGLGLGIRMLTAYVARHRLLDAFLLPISVFLLTLIAGQSLVWHWSHAANWKGRKIQNAR